MPNFRFQERRPFNPVMTKEAGLKIKESLKKFQYRKETPPDPIDEHVHEAAFDENGNGMTTVDGNPPHAHQVWNFRVEPYNFYDPYYPDRNFMSMHPGSLVFKETLPSNSFDEMESMTPAQKKKMEDCMKSGGDKAKCLEEVMKSDKKMTELFDIDEMEIFRPGTHNGDEFTDKDLQEIANNFKNLQGEVRPKLKITHSENQKSLAGLASYGDIVDVFVKKVADGSKRLFAKIANVPKEIIDFIKDRRFPERSIELYSKLKIGAKEDSPIYRNVLKAIALLGHEMPAVTGMEPVMLSETIEAQTTVCFNEICFECEEKALEYLSFMAKGIEIDQKRLNIELNPMRERK